MTEVLFDLTDEYEAMLNQGIRLSGEGMLFFLEGRLGLHQRRLQGRPILKILDFGCGLGYASKRLREIYPQAQITGADTSARALEGAELRNGGPGIRFLRVSDLPAEPAEFDLCYVSGVFHHIPEPDRPQAVQLIQGLLKTGGSLALFENNPWNFGARMVMARIPFDRGAKMLSPMLSASLMRRAGFQIRSADSIFYFPRSLRLLRPAEPYLSQLFSVRST